MCAGPEGGHLGGAFSCADVLAALYFSVLNVDPLRPDDPDRDRFLLSKGHAAVGLYATLAERGFFPVEELAGYGRPGSRLMGHPVRAVPGVEMPTGSLGHGLALGCGFALAARYAGRASRTFVLLGDGELQEGSVWEAAIAAASLRPGPAGRRGGPQRTAADRVHRRHRADGTAGRPLAQLRLGGPRRGRPRPEPADGPSQRRAVGGGQAERADRPHGQGPWAPVPGRPQCQPLRDPVTAQPRAGGPHPDEPRRLPR